MKLHLIGLPFNPINDRRGQDAFTCNLVNFRKMFPNCIAYGNEGSDGDYVQIYSQQDMEHHYRDQEWFAKGEVYKASFDYSRPEWTEFNSRVIEELKKRLAPQDIICSIGGLAHKQIADAFPNHLFVEHGIGYEGSFAKYRVFESYAWMHYIYGKQGIVDGRFFDTVIPAFFDPKDFIFSDKKEDYLLFMSRPIERKGLEIVKEIAKHHRVVVAGAEEVKGPGIEWAGYADQQKKAELISKAKAVLMPTIYFEPLGKVSLEAGFGGTPVITTDFGAFPENVIQGVTGMRCSTLKDFLGAIDHYYNYFTIRRLAIERFSLPIAKKKYEKYFNDLLTLFDKGWYQV